MAFEPPPVIVDPKRRDLAVYAGATAIKPNRSELAAFTGTPCSDGPSRRAALMDHFGSIDRLRAATAAEIADVPGFCGRMAAELHAFLHRAPESTAHPAPPADPPAPEE